MSATDDDLVDRIVSVRRWKSGDAFAPHKPLLLLLALARVQHGAERDIPYPEIEGPLTRLLRIYGTSESSPSPQYPFWRLQNDDRIWYVRDAETYGSRRSNTDPPVTELRDRPALGGFSDDVHAQIAANPALVSTLAVAILEAHFPESLHADLLSHVGLTLTPSRVATTRLRRDPTFAPRVLEAYEHRCAICEFALRLDGVPAGLEAAHLRWHCRAGASALDNGLALCPLHHKALDLGIVGLTTGHRVEVSTRVEGGERFEEHFLRYHGQPLRPPRSGAPPVSRANIDWHRRKVFKKPPRGAA